MKDLMFDLTPGFTPCVLGATCFVVYFHRAPVRFLAWMGAGFLGAGVINLILALTAVGIPPADHPAHKSLVLASMAFMLVGAIGFIAGYVSDRRSGALPLAPPLRWKVGRDGGWITLSRNDSQGRRSKCASRTLRTRDGGGDGLNAGGNPSLRIREVGISAV